MRAFRRRAGSTGSAASAALLRALLADSALRESHRTVIRACRMPTPCAACRRCTARRSTRGSSRGLMWRELNAATDNPLVLESGELLSGGNFHGQAVGMAADVLAIACEPRGDE
jgi:histidine ammonia-lyase